MISRVSVWLFSKLSGVILIAVLGLAAAGLWLYWSDTLVFESQREELKRLVSGEHAHLLEARRARVERRDVLGVELESERLRLATATRAVRALGELEENRVGERAEREARNRRLEQLRTVKDQASRRVEFLEQELRLEKYTLEGIDLALGRVEKRLDQARAAESKVLQYLRRAWESAKWHLVVALFAWLFGPTLWKLFLFHVFAPLLARGKPLRFALEAPPPPEVECSKVALELSLEPGEQLKIKECFLQASDEALRKRTRWLFDWRMPLTSLACGLTEMIELSAGKGTTETRRVTLSCASDPLAELSLVRIPEGSSLVLSPRHIAGVLHASGASAGIRTRWVFCRWQSWVSLQFRFFEFRGPMTIVLSGSRGIRVERLGAGGRPEARRVNRNAVIGFSPALGYTPVRAETFWAFYRGMNPLFDALFTGEGLFLCQASARPGEEVSERFWTSVWNGVLRVFGI